jgi:hypothetical protein
VSGNVHCQSSISGRSGCEQRSDWRAQRVLIGSDMTEKCVLRIPCGKEENELYEYASVQVKGLFPGLPGVLCRT